MSRVTAFISPTEFAAISARCRDSKRSVQLRFETTVVTDGIPQVPAPDHFVMNAELAAVRQQEGRNSTALALYYAAAMNGASSHASGSELTPPAEGDPCVVELGLDRCPPSLLYEAPDCSTHTLLTRTPVSIQRASRRSLQDLSATTCTTTVRSTSGRSALSKSSCHAPTQLRILQCHVHHWTPPGNCWRRACPTDTLCTSLHLVRTGPAL